MGGWIEAGGVVVGAWYGTSSYMLVEGGGGIGTYNALLMRVYLIALVWREISRSS